MVGLDSVYIGCAVLGGLLFFVQLVMQFLGHHADVDVGGGHVGMPHDVSGTADTSFKLLSFQGLTAFFMMFGLVGLAMHRQSGASPALSLCVAIAAGSALGLALFHAYDLIPVYAALGLTGVLLWARDRQFPRHLAVAGIAIAAASGPVAFYYQRLTATDPLWQRVLAQYVNAGAWTPPHLHLVVLMGLPLLLAIVAVATKRLDRDERLFAASWAACGLVLMYVPVVYQIKFLNGWQLPLAVLAVAAWHERVVPLVVRPSMGSGGAGTRPDERRAMLAGAVMVALALPTNLYFLAWRMTEMRKHDAPYFMHADEKAALDWLAANRTPQDVALAPLGLGQFVPNYGATRAFVAHWAMTVDFFARRDAAEQFFAADRLFAGAIKIAQDRRFLVRQANLLLRRVDQEAHGRAKFVGANAIDGVFAGFVTAQVRADAGQQNRELERL